MDNYPAPVLGTRQCPSCRVALPPFVDTHTHLLSVDFPTQKLVCPVCCPVRHCYAKSVL